MYPGENFTKKMRKARIIAMNKVRNNEKEVMSYLEAETLRLMLKKQHILSIGF